MASRLPPRSSSGRALKPSRRLREKLKDQIEEEYDGTRMELERQARKLELLLVDRAGEGEVKRCYDEWLDMYDELGITGNELRRYLEPEEVRQHDRFLGEVTMECEILKVKTEGYLRSRESGEELRKFLKPKIETAEEEVSAADERIKLMEEEINSTADLLHRARIREKTKKELEEKREDPRYSSTPFDYKGGKFHSFKEEKTSGGYTSVTNDLEDPMAYRNRYFPQVKSEPKGYDPLYRNEFLEPSPGIRPQEPQGPYIPKYENYYDEDARNAGADYSWIHMEPERRNSRRRDETPEPRVPRRRLATADPTVDVLNKLADILQNKKENRLPSMEPEKFAGDLMKFPSWISSYETLIEKRFNSSSEKMFYLQKYTTGEAHELISGFENFDTDEAYINAKRMLMMRYGDKIKIAETYRLKLNAWPTVKPGDRVALQKYSDFLWKCYKAMSTIGYLSSLDAPEENRKLVAKLPFYISDRWNRVIDMWVYDRPADYDRSYMMQARPYPPFSEFCKFLASESRVANGPCSAVEMKAATGTETEKSGKKSTRKTSLAVNVDDKEDTRNQAEKKEKKTNEKEKNEPRVPQFKRNPTDYKPSPKCRYCNEEHWLSECTEFISQPFETKKTFLMERGICFGCFRKNHTFKDCRIRRPELMRNKEPLKDKERTKSDDVVAMTTINSIKEKRSSMILPLWISRKDNPLDETLVYAAIDSQSNSCFITPELVETLSVPKEEVCIRLTTMGTAREVDTLKVQGLQVRGHGETRLIDLPQCYQEEEIPADRETIPEPSEVARWPHLEDMSSKLMPPRKDIEISLLLGYNCSAAFIQMERIFGDIYEPFAMKTPMGWSVMGKLSGKTTEEEEEHLCFTTSTREINSTGIKKIFDMGFEAVSSDVKVSQEDKRFLDIVQKSVIQREDGHLQLDLPLKEDSVVLPDNRRVAEKRLMSLKRKMKQDEIYSERYQKFINEMIENGQAEWVDEDSEDTDEGLVWYLPHMGVYHPRKPDKLRVVFDASARYLHASLNECLLSGPDMTNNLVGVLLRFRSERIAVTCDVEGMFHQVFVSPKFRNLLRFLWFEEGKPEGKIMVGRVLVHLFGASSSPGCANFAMKEVAKLFGDEYGEITAEFLRRFFYVDDGIISLRTIEEAVDLIYSSHSLCRKGGFWLHKFSSNSKEVIRRIPKFLRAVELKDWQPKFDNLPIETTLGVKWCRETDSFIFVVLILEKPETRRGMLSALSSVYDPLGLIAPILLKGRIMLQKLCSMKFDWDDDLPKEDREAWRTWYHQLKQLEDLKIPRCVKKNVDVEDSVQLHMFSDASVIGYGVCAYLRIADEDEENIDTSLVFSKARVAPSKYVTIPRLELQAALLSVKVGRFLLEELQYKDITITYWTDSKVTLGYIGNSTKRFHVYVSNRVTTIREMSLPEQWRYVTTEENPADLASRGVTPDELVGNEKWWKGPTFLAEKKQEATEPEEYHVQEDDPEVKNEKIALGIKVEEHHLTSHLKRVSTWRRMLRVVATCRRFVSLLRSGCKERKSKSLFNKPLTTKEIDEAEVILLRQLQKESFGETYEAIKLQKEYPTSREAIRRRNLMLKKNTNLYRLDVKMDEKALIRVGGRLKKAGFSANITHPILLPKDNDIVEKLIRHYHDKVAHAGRGSTLMTIRSAGYWIVHGRSSVEKAIRKCVTCRRLRGNLMGQKMADLPEFRLESMPPFTRTGVDVFGPFEVKQARSMKKRWICIFVDMVMRAVHVEILHSMDTSSFIAAFRRMIGRRGQVKELYCDRGSNFIGTDNEFKKTTGEMNLTDMKNKLVEENCDVVHFNFNFPKSSHMGGSWERLIRSFRSVFTRLLTQHGSLLDDELLQTLAVETESILNYRPLTHVNMSEVNDPVALTPMQLLTMKSQVVLPPPGRFVREDLYCSRRWRRVQYLSNQFWAQWLKEYVPTLHERRKWNEKKDNLKKNDIVLIFDENAKRNQWPLGRVADVVPGDDGLVRKAVIQTASGSFDRPIHKLVFLMRPTPDDEDE